MQLDDAQKSRVAQWISEGLKLSEIQSRLTAELGLNLTYMEVRFLVDDLKLVPKDTEPPKPPVPVQALPQSPQGGQPGHPLSPQPEAPSEDDLPPAAGGVTVSVDSVTRPGTLVSGTVTFSDGQTGMWGLDQMGRLAFAPRQKGYRPSPEDVDAFQMQLQREMQKLGY